MGPMLGRANPVFIAKNTFLNWLPGTWSSRFWTLSLVQVIDIGLVYHASFGHHLAQIWGRNPRSCSARSETSNKIPSSFSDPVNGTAPSLGAHRLARFFMLVK